MKTVNKIVLGLWLLGTLAGSPDFTKADNIKKPLIENLNKAENLPQDFLTGNFTVNGIPANNLLVKDEGNNTFALTHDFKFEGIKGFSDAITLKIKTMVTLVYENNNIYVKCDTIEYPESVTVTNPKEIVIADVVYDVSVIPGQLKWLDVRYMPNPEKTKQAVLNRISGFTSKVSFTVTDLPELENLQLTGLTNLVLWEEIYQDKDGYYRSLLLKEGKECRVVRNIYFDKKWKKLDLKKIADNNKPIKIFGENISTTAGFDSTWVMNIKDISGVDKITARVKAHQYKLIDLINKAKIGNPDIFVGANKEKKERVWAGNKEEYSYDTKTLKIKLIDDTYIWQRWANENQIIKFGVKISPEDPKKDQIVLKNIVGTEVESFDIKAKNKWWEDFYTVRIENDQLMIDKIKASDDVLTQEFPEITWDKSVKTLFSADAGLLVKKDTTKISYFDANGKKIASFPSTLTDKGLWQLDKPSVNVQAEDLYNSALIEASWVDLVSLNLTQKDMMDVFKALLTKEKTKLEERKAVAVYDKDNNKYVYYTVEQHHDGDPYVLTKDVDLYLEAEDILKELVKNLKMINLLQNTQLRWMNNGKAQRFEWFVWWWGLEKAPLDVNNVLEFLKENTRQINQTVVWGEWSRTDLTYKVAEKDVKFSKERTFKNLWLVWKSSKIKSPISGQVYSISLEFNGKIVKLTFDPVEKKK